ncbi:hypothetical protein HMPREF9621_02853 [Cutibacterium modestum HL037PA2]|nr:hypothetical protein HMPREF9621_02853 [Cutibacterium modestum HL037PA2]
MSVHASVCNLAATTPPRAKIPASRTLLAQDFPTSTRAGIFRHE